MRGRVQAILAETLLVGTAGLAFSLGANLLSPRGLSLKRDYFPRTPTSAVPAHSGPQSTPGPVPSTSGGAHTSSADGGGGGEAAARLRAQGLQSIEGPQALQLFRDPAYAQEQILFVDARDDAHYAAGHIPGAYQFDRYYPERYLPAVLPACLNATKVVVYCAGGSCEDSEFAAVALKEAGVPADALVVYLGGFGEWTSNQWPREMGARHSGVLAPAPP